MQAGIRTTSLLRLLLFASVAGPACILGMSGWLTYRQAFSDARQELNWTSEVALEHASKVFDSYALVADRVQDSLSTLDAGTIAHNEDALHRRFLGMIAHLPQIQSLIVLDRDAHLEVATDAAPVDRSIDFSDRDYFQALRSLRVETFISRLQTSRVTGKIFFGWGRSRQGPTGDFGGVIDIAVAPDLFSRFYETLVSEVGETPDGRVVTMIRDDGQILVRYPAVPGPPPKVAASNPFFDAVRTQPDGGNYSNTSLVDHGSPRRLFAFRKVPGHSIYIVAGRSLDAITAEWRRDMLLYLAVGVTGAAALFFLTLVTVRGAHREANALARVNAEMGRREMAEEQLRQAQKMEAVGQLTGGVAHDFNNLLTVISSSIDLLKRPNLTEDRRRRYIDAIADTTMRAAKLTGQLLAFARRQALQPEIFHTVERVRAMSDMLGTITGSRIHVAMEILDEGCTVNADASQFDTALVNMAVNARDAMAGDGVLTIRITKVSRLPAIRSRPTVEGEFVALVMADTGSGIGAADLDRIFEPFFTTKGVGQGTGLGLSQVFGFAQQSGGDITVESKPGQGTTFTLYLPRVADETSVPPPVDRSAALVDGHGTRVLMVEDNVDVGSFATQTLDELGYLTVLASDASVALAELANDADRFDVVFSDVVMPGMTGIELAQEIRRRHPDLPVVLTSGYSDVLAQNGPEGFELLQKPYSIDELSRVLQKAARGRRVKV